MAKAFNFNNLKTNKLFLRLSIILLLIIVAPYSHASVYQLDLGVRSYIFGGALEASAEHQWKLWGGSQGNHGEQNSDTADTPEWKYGYVGIKSTLGSQGLYQLSLSFAPISIIELSYSRLGISRFYESLVFDCSRVSCKGVSLKDKYSVKTVLGYNEFYIIPVYQTLENNFGDLSKLTVDETENLLFNPSSDRLTVNSLILGYKLSNLNLNFLVRESRYQTTEMKNFTQMAIVTMTNKNHKCFGITMFEENCSQFMFGFGLGTYSTSDPKQVSGRFVSTESGVSALVFYRVKWGSSLGFF